MSLELFLYLLLGVFVLFLFHGLLGGEYPEISTFNKLVLKVGLPFTAAFLTFLIATPVFMSPVAGVIMAVLGWVLPRWFQENIRFRRLKENRKHAQNLATTAGGLFGGGMVTAHAFNYLGQRYPDPFGSEFKIMNTRKSLDPNISYPMMLVEMAEKYDLPEIRAKAKIIEAADKSGGSASTARGLKRLAKAIRLRNELIQDRIEGTKEPKIATQLSLLIIGGGLLLDITVFRQYFVNGGQLAVSLGCLFLVGIALAGRKATQIDDIK